MRHQSAKESARTLPRKWIDENWGFTPARTQHDNSGRPRKVRPRSAPTTRRKDKAFVYHTYTGRRVSPDQQRQQRQHQGPLHRRPLKGAIEDDTGVALPDSWGRGGGPSFAPKGVGPLLEPPRPPKGPTKPCWPTRTIGASALRYVGTVRQEKGVVDRAGPEGEIPTVSWPEHAAMETGDVVVTVEHCHGCHNHRMTTRHDPEVYLRQANAVRELLIESLQDAPIRLAVVLKKAILRPKALPRGGRGSGETGGTASAVRQRRVGAFEVQVAGRHPSQAHLLQVRVVHSKLASGRWPRLETDRHLPTRVKATLASWGFQSNRQNASSVDAGPDGEGAGGKTPSEHHRPPPRPHMSWEFDNRHCLRDTTAPAAPSGEDNNSPRNSSSHSNTEARIGRASTPTSGNHDTGRRQGQTEPRGTPEDDGAATTVAKGDVGDAPPSSGGSAGSEGSGAGTTVNEATGKTFAVEGRDGGAGGDDGGMPHACGKVGAATDGGIGRESAEGSFEKASAVAAATAAAASTAITVGSPAIAKGPTTPPGWQRSGSEDGGTEGKKRNSPEEVGLFRPVRPAVSVDSWDGGIAAAGLEDLLGDERDGDDSGDLETSADLCGVDRIADTPPRSGRGRRREHEGEDGGSSPASAREGNSSETSRNSSPARSVRGRQENNGTRASSSAGEARRTPGLIVQGALQAPDGRGGAQDNSEASRTRESNPILEGNPAAADDVEENAVSVWSNTTSSDGGSTGRNTSPTKRTRGPPKAEGEAKSVFETPATTNSGGHDEQEKTKPTSSRKAPDGSGEPREDDGAAEEKGEKFAQPKNASNKDAHPRSRGGGGIIGEGGDGGSDSGGSVASPTNAGGVVKPTNRAAPQREPGATEGGKASDVESRRSRGYQHAGGGGLGETGAGGQRTVGDSSTAGEGEPTMHGAAEEDEYGSDFASQDASSIEEVDEESAVSEGAPPLVPPREDVGVGESGEEFQWSDAEEKEKEEEEVEEAEDEYGDDFDDDGGDFDSS